MRLRSQMLLLALGAMAPLLVAAVLAGGLLLQQQRTALERDALGRARAAMSAMDAELLGVVSTVEALTSSKALADRDLRKFHEEMRRIQQSQPNWLNVTLMSADGQRLLESTRAYDDATQGGIDADGFGRALASRAPAVGSISKGSLPTPAVRVHLPVQREGAVTHVLTAALRLERFAYLLREQKLPDNWVIALLDREARFIVRIPHRTPGDQSSQSFREALASAPEGFFQGQTTEGLKSYTGYVTSTLSGWALGIAVPRAEADVGLWHLAIGLSLGGLLAVTAAFGLSHLLGRRISAPIASLATASEALQRGAAVQLGAPSPIAELASLQRALTQAAAAVDERQALQEREKAALRSADRAKDEFLAMLSHELRNPLSALVAASQLLRHARLQNPMAEQACGVVERQTRHMARLVDDLLDVSRTMMGKVELKPEPLDLAELVRGAMAGWRLAGRFDNHVVSVQAEGTATVIADRVRLEQVLSNLIDNALKFTPAGGPVLVGVTVEPAHAVLQVEDGGIGFAAGAEAWLFDLFRQGEQGLDRRQGGMGIGLAMVRRLAEMHGGTAQAHSNGPGLGARFTVRLPLAATEPPRSSSV
jgi:signal transduction histidine kinase